MSATPTRTERISVIIPTYNRAALVPRAVESALAAMEAGDELLVIDDGSTDHTADALAPYAAHIRYIRSANAGAGAARNRGVQEARHPWVAFLDSDDTWFVDHLTVTRQILAARPDVILCFSDFALKAENGTNHPHYLSQWYPMEGGWDALLGAGVPYSSYAPLPPGRDDFLVHIGDMYLPLMIGGYVSGGTPLIRRAAAGSHLRFEVGVPTFEEWFAFARVARHGASAFLACDTLWNHGHAGPRITTSVSTYDETSTRLLMLESIWGRDAAFLHQHAEEYQRVRTTQYLRRARWLISRGRLVEARCDLRRAGGGTLVDRALASLPAPLASGMGQARRTFLRILRARGAPLLTTAVPRHSSTLAFRDTPAATDDASQALHDGADR